MAEVHVLVVAAGRSERFGGVQPKQYHSLAGSTVLEHAIRPFLDHPAITDVTAVIAQDDDRFGALSLIRDGHLHAAEGGPQRAHSVLNGLHALSARGTPFDAMVMVHDGARPCVTRHEIDALLALGEGILVAEQADSLKRCDDRGERVLESVLRDGLCRALTPQCFQLGRLSDAIAAALASGRLPGDEAQAIEWAGGEVLVAAGKVSNIKITTADDLVLAEAILAGRGQR
jgi:2-C-methyl-D-erythritol 4-phosphate cytidylyltransferase